VCHHKNKKEKDNNVLWVKTNDSDLGGTSRHPPTCFIRDVRLHIVFSCLV